MWVHIEIASCAEGEDAKLAPGQQRQHVVEERKPGVHIGLTGAVNHEFHRDLLPGGYVSW
jgi:hypothetical protein